MALVFKDRVKETTTTTGTGTVTLAGAMPGFQSFSAIGNGNTTNYAIVLPDTGEWEVGVGTYTASGTTLSRDTVLSSSNSGSLVNFGIGNKEVFVTYPASYSFGTSQTLPVASGGTGLTTYTPNGILYASGSGTLASGAVLTFDGTNVINSGAYTAPSNGAGAGTKTTIQGSTGTGAAGVSGGNGFIELVGGGGTSAWTSFTPGDGARRRGGINLQAGTSQADAGGTYVNGSTIELRGSNGTNNGVDVGEGTRIGLTAGATTKLDGSVSSGSGISLGSGNQFSGGVLNLYGGAFATSAATNFAASLLVNSANATTAGNVVINAGSANTSGSSGGSASLVAGNSTGVAGANVVLTSGTGTANGKVSIVVGALGEVVQVGPTGAIGLSGANYGTTGQALLSQGSGSAPVWGTVSPACATPCVAGIVFGGTTICCCGGNTLLGHSSSASGAQGVAVGISSSTANFGVAVGKSANAGYAGVSVGINANSSFYPYSVALGACVTTTGFCQTHIGPIRNTCCTCGLQGLFYCSSTKEVIRGASASVACATPTVAGIVYGRTDLNCSPENVSLGYNTVTTGSCNTVIGSSAIGCSSGGVVIGKGASINNCCTPAFCAVVVGRQAFSNGRYSVVIGSNAIAFASGIPGACGSIAIGNAASSGHSGSIAIGKAVSTTGICQTHIGPIRNTCSTSCLQGLFYCASSKEVIRGAAGGGSPATPTAAGIVFGVTNSTNTALGACTFVCTSNGVAVGYGAGVGCNAIAIGRTAYAFGCAAINIGRHCGSCTGAFGQNSITIGKQAVTCSAASASIAIGQNAAAYPASSIAIGLNAYTGCGLGSIALGSGASACGGNSIAIGAGVQANASCQTHIGPIRNACSTSGLQGLFYCSTTKEVIQGAAGGAVCCAAPTVAGVVFGKTDTCGGRAALGYQAGATSQGGYAVAIGSSAGQYSQSTGAVAIGLDAGYGLDNCGCFPCFPAPQGSYAVAIGGSSGRTGQGNSAVAVGGGAGYYYQGAYAVAIGSNAGGYYQPCNSTAIGPNVNATSSFQTHIGPIRNSTGPFALYYCPCTREVTYN